MTDMSPSEAVNETIVSDDVMVIDSHGDLLLHVNYHGGHFQRYRVSISALCQQSSYFSSLLDSTKFSEGIAVESRLADLRKMHTDIASVPAIELPRVGLSDVGIGVDTAGPIVWITFGLFLGILHGSPPPPVGRKSHLRLLYAHLAFLADILAAIPSVSRYVYINWAEAQSVNIDPTRKRLSEFKIRQMLYIGLTFGFSNLVAPYSAALVVWGSTRWRDVREANSAADEEELPWDYLDRGVEGKPSQRIWVRLLSLCRRISSPPSLCAESHILVAESFLIPVSLARNTMHIRL